jgi:hypothetical protein
MSSSLTPVQYRAYGEAIHILCASSPDRVFDANAVTNLSVDLSPGHALVGDIIKVVEWFTEDGYLEELEQIDDGPRRWRCVG